MWPGGFLLNLVFYLTNDYELNRYSHYSKTEELVMSKIDPVPAPRKVYSLLEKTVKGLNKVREVL